MLSLTLQFRFTRRRRTRDYWPSITSLLARVEATGLREVLLRFEDLYGSFRWDFVDWPELSEVLVRLYRTYPSLKVTFTFLFRSPRPIIPYLRERLEHVLTGGLQIKVVITILDFYTTYNHRSYHPMWRTWYPKSSECEFLTL